MKSKKNATSFSKDKQPDYKTRPRRGKAKQTLMLEAVREVCGSEEEFLQEVIKIGLGDQSKDIPSNPTLLTLAINRLEPPMKSVAPVVDFEFDKNAKPHEQATYVLDAISNGKIPPDIGVMFISAIKSLVDIEEYTMLKERIELLEESIK